jgi:peptidoglycan/LPS O-acetylase OafA/YrhL
VKALSATDVVEDLLFVPHFRADADTYPVLDVGWTLDFEMFFYFLFGLTFFLKSQAQALGALVLIFVAGALLDHFHAPLPHAAETYFQPLTLEFAAGGALALLYRREFLLPARAHRLAGLALLAAGLALLAWNGLKDGEFVSWNFELRAQTFGVPATMIVAGALMLELGGLAARSSFLMLLGAASYSIYLVHHIVVQYLARAGAVLLPDASAPVLIAAGAAMFVVAASVGVAAHLWIEKPITRMLKRPRGNRTAVPA